MLSGLSHFAVGLDTDDRIAVIQKQPAEHARSGTDIRDDRVGVETTLVREQVEYLDGITRAILGVIFHPG